MWKMTIQYTVPGFEHTTFETQVSSHNHYTRMQLWNRLDSQNLMQQILKIIE